MSSIKTHTLFALAAAAALPLSILAHPHSSSHLHHHHHARSSTGTTPCNLCGVPNDYEIISDTHYIVYSMNYAYEQMVGTCCTGFTGLSTSSSGAQQISWNSTWDITEESATENVVKGYSFVGLTQGLEVQLSAVESIPTTYHWVRSNETQYKGNVCYDFMVSPTSGDSTSSSAQELMLWLRYEGGQLPIGYSSSGPVATISLYNKSWSLYQGVNEDTGITVSSLIVDENDQYYGNFEGDLKDWLMALVNQGVFDESVYVNVGNAGMEPFWGTVDFVNTLALQINSS